MERQLALEITQSLLCLEAFLYGNVYGLMKITYLHLEMTWASPPTQMNHLVVMIVIQICSYKTFI